MKSLTPIILILVAIAVFFFLIDPKYKQVQALQAEVSANEETLRIAAQLSKERDQLRAKFNDISAEEKAKLEKLLPDTVDNVRLIIYINNIAEQMGIVIRDINITDSTSVNPLVQSGTVQSQFEGIVEEGAIQYVDTTRVGVIGFSFSVAAQYDVFLDLLTQLEDSLRIVDIRDMEVSRGNGVEGVYDYKVSLDTYWLK